jgi:glycosyltransferase involved in cell wall biosynthesis
LVDMAHTPRPLEERRASGSLYRTGFGLTTGVRWAYEAMDAVLVLGERSRAQLVEAWPSVARVEVIPHGDYSTYPTPAPPPPSCSPPVVLFFGGWVRYKGIDLLLDAFECVRAALPDARLIVAGSVGADVDVHAIAVRAAAIGGVELIPRYIPVHEVGPLFGRARVVVAPYLAANQSGVVHLAHSLGRAVVATDVGDLRTTIRTGETGILVPPGNAQALATGLVSLLDEPEYADRLGAEARRQVNASASWESVASRLCDIYRSATDARVRASGRRAA